MGSRMKRPPKVTIASAILIVFGIFELGFTLLYTMPYMGKELAHTGFEGLAAILTYSIGGLLSVFSVMVVWAGYRISKGKYWVNSIPRTIPIILAILTLTFIRVGPQFTLFYLQFILFVVFLALAYLLTRDGKSQRYFRKYHAVDLPKRLERDYKADYKISMPLIVVGIVLLAVWVLGRMGVVTLASERNSRFVLNVALAALGSVFVVFGVMIRLFGKSLYKLESK